MSLAGDSSGGFQSDFTKNGRADLESQRADFADDLLHELRDLIELADDFRVAELAAQSTEFDARRLPQRHAPAVVQPQRNGAALALFRQ